MLLSDGLRTEVVGDASFGDAAGGYLSLAQRVTFYTGAMPATGDTAPTGTVIAIARQWHAIADITRPRGTFKFVNQAVGSIVAAPVDFDGNILSGNIQSDSAIESGVIGYALVGDYLDFGGNADGLNSYFYATVNTAYAEIIVDSINVTLGNSVGIVTFHMTVPERG